MSQNLCHLFESLLRTEWISQNSQQQIFWEVKNGCKKMARAAYNSWQEKLSQNKVVFNAKRLSIFLEEEARFHKCVTTSASESNPDSPSAQLRARLGESTWVPSQCCL